MVNIRKANSINISVIHAFLQTASLTINKNFNVRFTGFLYYTFEIEVWHIRFPRYKFYGNAFLFFPNLWVMIRNRVWMGEKKSTQLEVTEHCIPRHTPISKRGLEIRERNITKGNKEIVWGSY
jgi:hypothetical protein